MAQGGLASGKVDDLWGRGRVNTISRACGTDRGIDDACAYRRMYQVCGAVERNQPHRGGPRKFSCRCPVAYQVNPT